MMHGLQSISKQIREKDFLVAREQKQKRRREETLNLSRHEFASPLLLTVYGISMNIEWNWLRGSIARWRDRKNDNGRRSVYAFARACIDKAGFSGAIIYRWS